MKADELINMRDDKKSS